jgi:hypothetical protein
MEPYTLTRNFLKKDIVDEFESFIWTERYYGDSDVRITVPATSEMIAKLPLGIFLGITESNEIMILESRDFDDGNMTLSGISLLPWMNNRFVRSSPNHEDQYWSISGGVPGWILWQIIYNFCVEGSPYLNGTNPIGIINPEQLVIPGLGLNSYDTSGENISVGIPFGPVYDAAKEIATTYEVGMQITLDSVTDDEYSLGFRSYRGVDRTSGQIENAIVQFSPQLDTFTGIKELQSIAALKTLVYAFAPSNPDELAVAPGISFITDSELTGFDLRALQIFANDITTDMVGGDPAKLVDILNSRARDALSNNGYIVTVDGEVVPDNQFQYKRDYNLGDLVETRGYTPARKFARVTEFIRSQDNTGIKAYPTLTTLGSESDVMPPPFPAILWIGG